MGSTASQPQQLAFDLAHRPAFGAEDFFLSQSNELAIKLMDDWPCWARYGQVLEGPAASGKSHLVNVWRLRSKARIIKAKDLDEKCVQSSVSTQAICIEDLDRGLANQEALFHLLNKVSEQGGHVLLTSRAKILTLDIELKDLRSRLLALPVVSINAPDDRLLKAVMIKLFLDRQIDIEPQLIEYLFNRMERSMLSVARLVDDLDRGSLGTGRRITKPLARKILSSYQA